MNTMKFFWIGLVFCLPAMAQQSLDIRYLIRFNDGFAGDRNDRLHSGLLITGGGLSSFMMVARTPFQPKDASDVNLSGDTLFQIRTDQQSGVLYSWEGDFTGERYWISDSLWPMEWNIREEKKQIGELACQQAFCRFRGRNYQAWFAPEIPVSAGPWKMGGLPGLIVEMEDDQQHMVVRLEAITATDQVTVLPKKVRYDWPAFASRRNTFYKRLKDAARAVSTGNCISCQQESQIDIVSWEAYD
jgi:hypothetical protein